jgi:hypothetical protein
MPTYPRETTEFVSVRITLDGQTVTDGVAFSVVPRVSGKPRPAAWVGAQVLDAKTGFMLMPSEAGDLQVWARVTDSPEVPIIDCGTITRT